MAANKSLRMNGKGTYAEKEKENALHDGPIRMLNRLVNTIQAAVKKTLALRFCPRV